MTSVGGISCGEVLSADDVITADAFEEAAKYLDSVKAINTVKYNVGLTHVAKEVVDAAAKTDDINSLDELEVKYRELLNDYDYDDLRVVQELNVNIDIDIDD